MLRVVEIELQALITEREGMVAYNQYRCLRGETVAYPDEAFLKLAEQIRALNIKEAGQQFGETPAQHGQLAICAACGNVIRQGKPVATGFHCVICGAALPHKQQA